MVTSLMVAYPVHNKDVTLVCLNVKSSGLRCKTTFIVGNYIFSQFTAKLNKSTNHSKSDVHGVHSSLEPRLDSSGHELDG